LPRHFLTGSELSAVELLALLGRAAELKAAAALIGRAARPHRRARLPEGLDAHARVLRGRDRRARRPPDDPAPDEMQLSRGESVKDTALVLSRHVDAVGVRTGPDALLEELAAEGSIPVFNMLTAATIRARRWPTS
jgi:ornithine carbamoyltransferase